MAHFHSAHAYLGAMTVGLLVVQYLFGFTIWYVLIRAVYFLFRLSRESLCSRDRGFVSEGPRCTPIRK
jgi:hypothetical protein